MQEPSSSQTKSFNPDIFVHFEYFKQGKEFTSGKQIAATITKVFHDSKQMSFCKGSLVYSEGQKSDYGYFLIEGTVALVSTLPDHEIFDHKHRNHKVTELEKKQLIAHQLDIKPSNIKFNTNLFCPNSVLEKRLFTKLSSGSTFGLSEMLKSGIRPFTVVTTEDSKVLMFHKKQFQSSLSAYELKRQDIAITPMCKQFVGTRGKQFLFSVFPSTVKKHCTFNEVLYHEGQIPLAIYFILKGEFEIYKTQKNKQGNTIDLQNLRPTKDTEIPIKKKQQGEFIGMEEVVLNLKQRQFSVRSTQSSIIFKIQADKFSFILDDFFEIKKGLQKYLLETHQRNINHCNKVFQSIQSGFKIQKSTHLEDQKKLEETIHKQLYSGKNKRSKSTSPDKVRGYSVNLNCHPYSPQQKSIKKCHNNNEQQQKPLSFEVTPQKMRSKSIDLRKSTLTARASIENNIKIDQKAYKRVMIKMGTYNVQPKTSIPRVKSAFKNSFEPIIDEIVRRHNTFMTKLDHKKRKEFVESKFREVVDKRTIEKSTDRESTMYKTWTVRSMKRSMKKYQQALDIPLFTQPKKESHQEILSRFDGIIIPSSTRQSKTSKGNRQFSEELTKRTSSRGSARNKLVLVNHMMKPLVYFHNS